MSKDAVATMGDLLPEDAGGRDAVHVAVFSAFSAKKLKPGQNVAIVGIDHDAEVTDTGDFVGIVDPFLKGPVPVGSRFWVYLYPRSITALSHRWAHPAFENTDSHYVSPTQKLASEKWLRQFTDTADCPGYERTLELAKEYLDRGQGEDYLHCGNSDAHGEIPDEFWDHMAVLTGKYPEQRPKYFSCSC